jgi:RimJ/RimL family protein N-acetyltransferase
MGQKPQVDLSAKRITTARMHLIPATALALEAELAGDLNRFQQLLQAEVSDTWPPPLYDDQWRKLVLSKLPADPSQATWWVWYFLRSSPRRQLIGAGGFKGPPTRGCAEIGYSVLESFQRQGLATEAANGLVAWAFAYSEVSRVVAHTLPELHASIRVLENNGFQQRGQPEEPDTIRFELERPTNKV